MRMERGMRRGMGKKWEWGILNFRGDLWKLLDGAKETKILSQNAVELCS